MLNYENESANKKVITSINGKELDKKDWFSVRVYNLEYKPIIEEIYNIANQFNIGKSDYIQDTEDDYTIEIFQGDTTKPFINTGK